MSLKSTFKGFLGETVINVTMWLKLEKDVYHRLNKVTLPLAISGKQGKLIPVAHHYERMGFMLN